MKTLIIGAGIHGLSTAYHLAKMGHTDVTVLEKSSTIGTGSTSKATGGFRAFFASKINIDLSLLSLAKLQTFQEETGIDPGYQDHGYLIVAQNEKILTKLASAEALATSLGLDATNMLSKLEVLQKNPHIQPDFVYGGAFCKLGGFINPTAILKGYHQACKNLGVEIVTNVQDFKPLYKDEKLYGLKVKNKTFEADAFVIATGAWSSLLENKFHISIPITPSKHQVASTLPTELLPSDMPMTVFLEDGFHLRYREGRILLLWPENIDNEAKPFDISYDRDWAARIWDIATQRIPILTQTSLDHDHSWAGLYELSPDAHVLLGHFTKTPNLYICAGASGHGVMHSLASGQVLGEMIAGKDLSIDVECLSPNRFKLGKEIYAPSIL